MTTRKRLTPVDKPVHTIGNTFVTASNGKNHSFEGYFLPSRLLQWWR
jgi:hypothetical protein